MSFIVIEMMSEIMGEFLYAALGQRNDLRVLN